METEKTELTKRTQGEIVARLNAIKNTDVMGFQSTDLIAFLDYEHAKSYIREGLSASEFAEAIKEVGPPSEQIKEYLPFAWEKANNARGISAYRSLCHLGSWLWLDGNDALSDLCLGEYEFYGKPTLEKVSEAYGVNWKVLDNGRRVNSDSE